MFYWLSKFSVKLEIGIKMFVNAVSFLALSPLLVLLLYYVAVDRAGSAFCVSLAIFTCLHICKTV